MKTTRSNAQLPPVAQRQRNVLLRECRVHEKLLDKLERAIDQLDEAGLSAATLHRLLEFSINLGRRNANMATDHVEHERACSQYHDPAFIAQLEKECAQVFAQPIDLNSEKLPTTNEP